MPAIRTLVALLLAFTFAASVFAAAAPKRKPPAEYSATRNGKTITLTATGENPTPGWTNTLAPAANVPTAFTFTQMRPAGIVAQVITPFSTSATVDSEAKMLMVVDSAGKHEVAVKDETK